MNVRNKTSRRTGAALLVVLIIVMTITITALGFVSQSDVELLCGRNMVMRAQMDYLAESGLEHARGLILNPQDARSPGLDYWAGGTNLQLTSGNDFYNVTVDRNLSDFCNYTIDCDAYRLEGTEPIGLSRLRAELRLDPCIAYWVGSNTAVSSQMTINGDVYCGGTLTNNGTINGDIFAAGTITGTDPEGQKKPAAEAGVSWPNLTADNFEPTYYIGSNSYSAYQIADSNIPSSATLSGVCYRIGDVNMLGNVTVNGTLVVDGDLTIDGGSNVITAEPNFPALLVSGQVIMKDNSSLVINGLAQIGQEISDDGATSTSIEVTGALFINNGGITSSVITVNVKADPAIASIEAWWPAGVARRWGPAGGAFFKSIERVQ